MKKGLEKVGAALKAVWGRLTSSKVAWMALPAGIAQVVLAVSGVDVGPTMEAVFAGVWTVLAVFLAANNPTDKAGF
ncbi:MAG: hypothetical protein RR946_10755 [Clostridia bacterium]